MAESPHRNFVWIYILAGILALVGLVGLVRGDWVSSGYVLGAVGLAVWIYGTRQRRQGPIRLGLVIAGTGVVILLFDLVLEFLA